MKIYVVGKFEDVYEVRKVMHFLEGRGHEITHDWTPMNDSAIEGAERLDYRRACAHADIVGVVEAEAILVLNHPNLHGGMLEIGYALAIARPIYLVDRAARDSVFFEIADVHTCANLADAITQMEKGV